MRIKRGYMNTKKIAETKKRVVIFIKGLPHQERLNLLISSRNDLLKIEHKEFDDFINDNFSITLEELQHGYLTSILENWKDFRYKLISKAGSLHYIFRYRFGDSLGFVHITPSNSLKDTFKKIIFYSTSFSKTIQVSDKNSLLGEVLCEILKEMIRSSNIKELSSMKNTK